jgi:hypothetical protein
MGAGGRIASLASRMRVPRWSSMCGLSAGAGIGLLTDVLISHRTADRRAVWAAVGLVVAASMYPLTRRRPGLDPSEAWTVLIATVIASISVAWRGRPSRSLLGLGWMCHALFDLAFGHVSSTWRLPQWYPALCAGFDIAYGARLLRPGERAVGPRTSARERAKSD